MHFGSQCCIVQHIHWQCTQRTGKGLRNNVLITDTLDRLLYINMINEFPTRLSWADFLLNVTVLKWHVRHKRVWNYILLCFENDLIATVDICCLFPFRAMSYNIYVQYLTHSYTLVNVYCSLKDSPPYKKVLANILKCFRHNKFKRQG